jgi:PAS domain S-box-containing protein
MKILIVEDEIIIAKDIENTLIKDGFNVVGFVSTGEKAIEEIQKTNPELILMDIKLKGKMDGIETAEIIKNRFDLPVIYLTSYKDEKTLLRAKITEPYGYIIKPFDPKELKILIDISYYKHKTREKLKEGKEWLSTTLKSIGDGVIAANSKGTIQYMNPTAVKLTGWLENETRNISVNEVLRIYDENDKNIFINLLSSFHHKKFSRGKQNNLFLLNKNNNKIPVDFNSSPIINEKNRVLGVVFTFRDISESRKASEKIRESEERFRQLAENIRDVFYVKNKDFNEIIYVSPAFEEIWGRPSQELNSLNEIWNNSIFPEDRDFVFDKISEIESSKGFEIEYRIIRPDRKIRWIRDRVFPIKDKNGITFRYTGIVEDVSEQKIAEEEVRKLSYAIQQNPALIVITDPKGNIEYVNPKFSTVTGYSFDEVKGKNPKILKSGFTKPEEYKILWKTIIAGGEWRGDFYNKKKNGEYYWESALISPIKNRNDEITHFVAVKEDITKRKRQEEQLIIAKEEAEKSDRLKSEFLAQMSHEIRTPLNNILTYASLLKDELESQLPAELEPSFRVINSSALRLLRTIDLILSLSKIQTGNFDTYFEKIDLDEDVLYEIILEFYTRANEKNIKLNYEVTAKSKKVLGDIYSIGQIFVNLIDNAIKYTNEGEIKITLYNNNENEVCVDVIDSGTGISEEFLPALFDPFTQEDNIDRRNYEGTGLGLALVKKYVEINNAKIRVSSKKDKGTTFTIIFKPAGN